MKTRAKPSPIDTYLAGVPAAHRGALERVRAIVRNTYPKAEESTYYGLPAFTLRGKALIAFRSTKSHCALHPLSGTVVDSLAARLKGFETSKGTIRFTPDTPLPEAIVRAILRARARELAASKR